VTTAPSSTYRLQISADFTLDDAVAQVQKIADLGVSHLYLSPLLQAAPGSTHGYDVVNHASIDESRGGEAALRRLAEAAHSAGLGLILDVVPNHMSVAVPRTNAAWWDLLRFGQNSAYVDWFDVDWAADPLLLPVLGSDDDVDKIEVVVEDDGPELAYFDHRFPIAPGTDVGTAAEVHERQAYRLVGWRREAAELTYRRFFDVTSLAGLRIEDRGVYDATHELVLRLVREGVIDGLRIDHPDGLAQPGSYLDWLAEDTSSAWVVVEKILEPGERMPTQWATAGTTGYDAARLVTGVFVDPAGEQPMTDLWQARTGDQSSFGEKVLTAKRAVTSGVLAAEVARLHRLAPEASPAAIGEVLAQFPVYRSYLPGDGLDFLRAALTAARAALPDLSAEFDALEARLSDGSDPFAIRFQQTSGMVMAKGVEDTAFYRHHVLVALNEVGGDPARFGVSVDEFHTESAELQATWPKAMTLLSSHDTKRSEDVRARIALLSEIPAQWAKVVGQLDAAAAPFLGRVAPDDTYLLHQTLVGIGPVDADRVVGYLEKATREAKVHTSWTDPDEEYDADVQSLVRGVLADRDYLAVLTEFLSGLESAWQQTLSAQKLLQLTMPGIPDLYQGSERIHLALVDPDNRRPVEWTAAPDDKAQVVRSVLTLRREHPELFTGYEPVPLQTPYALAFHRSPELLVVVRRLALGQHANGWSGAELPVPEGEWRDELTGAEVRSHRLKALIGDSAGAVLRRIS
jgi:(1->4)-alpha-D-glucan 1-alpha-D-glucosylmutase